MTTAISQLVTLEQLGCHARSFPRLIFLDFRLPDLDGYMTARAIRFFEHAEGRPRVAIVAITGEGDIECVDTCLAAGMDGHLSKPARRARIAAQAQ